MCKLLPAWHKERSREDEHHIMFAGQARRTTNKWTELEQGQWVLDKLVYSLKFALDLVVLFPGLKCRGSGTRAGTGPLGVGLRSGTQVSILVVLRLGITAFTSPPDWLIHRSAIVLRCLKLSE